MKHLFEQVSTLSSRADIVQVFDERMFDVLKENLMSAMASTIRSTSYVLCDPLPAPDYDSYSGAVRSLDSAPSLRRRREALRRDAPSSLRRPIIPVLRPARRGVHVAGFCAGVVATFVLSVIAAGAGVMLSPGTYSGPTAVHAVTSGESVWSIAQNVRTDRPLEEVVTDIEALNGIEGALLVGDLIKVPIY